MSNIDQIKSSKTKFDKKVLSAIQHLHPYVKHRLYIAETKGILPKNMYNSNGIIDDGIAELYQSGFDIDSEAMAIKLKLFQIIDAELDVIFKKEAFHQITISTDTILKEELSRLNEDFTMDADMDLILNTELDDISYHQQDPDHIFVYHDSGATILKDFERADISNRRAQHIIGKFYNWLPMNVSNIVDLFSFGKLSYEDISKIKHIEVKRVEHIIEHVIKRLGGHLT